MSERRAPLSVLDLVPIPSGCSAADAVRNSVNLAGHAERLGYHRYWFAEHHLNPGVAGTAPAIMTALVAAATTSIRVGSAGVQMGHRTPLSVVEEFGLLDSAYPGRIDLGLGRTLAPPKKRPEGTAAPTRPRARPEARMVGGVLIPSPPSLGRLRHSPVASLQRALLRQPEAVTPEYADQVGEILALLAGSYRSQDGVDAHIVPGERADVQVWILGSSGGASAEVAGRHGLRFAANYHVSPATILDAVDGYRNAFGTGGELERPHVCVSVDAVVADTEERAHDLASSYALWVLTIRSGQGAIRFPTPEEAAAHVWTDDDRKLVKDRVDTQLVGTPAQVAEQLAAVVDLLGANEVAVTTMTHDHADRVRSYELLADIWNDR